MQVIAKDGPNVSNVGNATTKETGPSSRERAIAALLNADKNKTENFSAEGVKAKAPLVEEPKVEESPVNSASEGLISNIEESTETVASPSEAVTEAPKEDPISSQFAILARKEKALRAKSVAQEQAIKSREDALRAKEEAIKLKESEYQTRYVPKDRIRNDLPSLLAEAGLSSEEIGELISNAPSAEEVSRNSKFSSYDAKIKALEDKLEAATKSVEDRDKRSYDQALNQISNDVKKLVAVDPTYELIHSTGSVGDVVKLIQSTFDTEGTLLDIEDACAQVENELLEDILKVSRLKKIQDKLSAGTKPLATAPKASGAPLTQSQPMKTLTNATAAVNKLGARERAIRRFKGEQF